MQGKLGRETGCKHFTPFFTVNNLFLFCSIKLDWNNLDSTLKTAKSISTFKFCLKNKLITDFLNNTL